MFQEEQQVICCLSTVVRLANDFKNIIAIKEAAGDIVQAMKLIQHSSKRFSSNFW